MTHPSQYPTIEINAAINTAPDDEGDQSALNALLGESASSLQMSSTWAPDQHLTEDSVRAFLVDFHSDQNDLIGTPREGWVAFVEKTHKPCYRHITNKGTPHSRWEKIDLMFTSKSLIYHSLSLVSVDNIILLSNGAVAVVTYTVDQIFSFQGVENADRCVYTLVLEEVCGVPMLVQEQRSNGMPIPQDETRWKPNALTRGPHKRVDSMSKRLQRMRLKQDKSGMHPPIRLASARGEVFNPDDGSDTGTPSTDHTSTESSREEIPKMKRTRKVAPKLPARTLTDNTSCEEAVPRKTVAPKLPARTLTENSSVAPQPPSRTLSAESDDESGAEELQLSTLNSTGVAPYHPDR